MPTVSRLAAFLVTFALASCGGSSEPPPEYPPMDEPEATTTTVQQVEDGEPEPPPPPPVQVVAGDHTEIEGEHPALRFRAPRNNQLIRRGAVNVRIAATNWELAPAPGRHIHLIVDNEPYIALRDISGPIDLVALVQDKLGHPLEPGTHVLRIFASRGHHESVKDARAFASLVFHYQSRTEDHAFDDDGPHLVYSRPKGCNIAGNRVLLDFYLHNLESLAADAHRVRYTIGDVSGDMTSWQPHYIENLPLGEHEVRIQLIGPDGEPVVGPFNDTTRTITVAHVCEAATPPCPDAPPEGECSVNRQVCEYTEPRRTNCTCADDGSWRCTE